MVKFKLIDVTSVYLLKYLYLTRSDCPQPVAGFTINITGNFMSKPSEQRRNITIAIVVIVGLVIGLFIKRVPLGLFIGVVLGLLASGLSSKGK